MGRAGGYDTYSFVAELYDHVVPYRERGDVAFLVEMAQQTDGAVLEIGCGTGRVLIPTARAGKEIIGLDLSDHMLAVCREKLAREPAEVQSRARLVKGDMRQFDLGCKVGLATIPLIYDITHPDGREERLVHRFPIRYLFRFEAEHLLVRSGFQVEALYADYDKTLYGSKYPGELIFIARKV